MSDEFQREKHADNRRLVHADLEEVGKCRLLFARNLRNKYAACKHESACRRLATIVVGCVFSESRITRPSQSLSPKVQLRESAGPRERHCAGRQIVRQPGEVLLPTAAPLLILEVFIATIFQQAFDQLFADRRPALFSSSAWGNTSRDLISISVLATSRKSPTSLKSIALRTSSVPESGR